MPCIHDPCERMVSVGLFVILSVLLISSVYYSVISVAPTHRQQITERKEEKEAKGNTKKHEIKCSKDYKDEWGASINELIF